MTRRLFCALPSLWQTRSGEVASDPVVWALQPAITTSGDHKKVWIDLGNIKADVVLHLDGGGLRFSPREMRKLFHALRKYVA
jgi:hypothetical protein